MKHAKNLTLLSGSLFLALAVAAGAQSTPKNEVWVGSWAASQQIPEPRNTLPPDDMQDATIRQSLRLSMGGDTLRVHISNAFGTEPLLFTSVHIARAVAPGSSAIVPGSDRALTFAGDAAVTVPPGAEYISDPIHYPVAPLTNLTITFHLDSPPSRETGHPGSRTTTYFLHGDHVADLDLPGAGKIEHWYQIAGVDVLAPAGAASIVALGDSITDGHATTTNGNDRWTDDLAERLQAAPGMHDIGVLNQGIGGNHLLTFGLGPAALARFDRDVLAQPGARWLIVFEGVNDLGRLSRKAQTTPAEHKALVHQIIAAYQQIIVRAHTHGIRVIGATITPFGGSGYYHPDNAIEADWQAVNTWIRTPGHFDAVVDFAKVVGDPANPDRLLPADDCGDHLHPNPAGYKALADSIPLSLFAH